MLDLPTCQRIYLLKKVGLGLLSAAGAQAARMSVDEAAGDYGEPEVCVGDVLREYKEV